MTEPTQECPEGVSVIIPTYNYGRYLTEAIDSALNSDYPNVEVVVVNDGSTDDTDAICKRYGDRIKYIYKENAGLSAARNTGIRAATFDVVAFLDSDDVHTPQTLPVLMGALAEKGPDYVLAAARGRYILTDGSVSAEKYIYRPFPGGALTARDFVMRNRFAPSVTVVRKWVFADDKAGWFDTNLRSSEDRDMWMRVAMHGKVWHINEPIIGIRRHRGNMSSQAERMRTSKRQVFEHAIKLGIVPTEDRPFWRQAHSFFHFESSYMFLKEGNRTLAWRELFLSWLKWPWFSEPWKVDQRPLFRLRLIKEILTWRNTLPED